MPRGKHLPKASAKYQRMYEDILREAKRSGRYKGREKELAARTVRARQRNTGAFDYLVSQIKRRDPGSRERLIEIVADDLSLGDHTSIQAQRELIKAGMTRKSAGVVIRKAVSKNELERHGVGDLKERAKRKMKARRPKKKNPGAAKKAIKTAGRAVKKVTRTVLSGVSKLSGSAAKALNPHRRLKVRNKYIDLVIKGQAKLEPKGWKVGGKHFTQGRGTVRVSSGYWLDKATGFVYAKRERNSKRNPEYKVSIALKKGVATSKTSTVKALTHGGAARKVKRSMGKRKDLYDYSVQRENPKKRRAAKRSLKKSSGMLKRKGNPKPKYGIRPEAERILREKIAAKRSPRKMSARELREHKIWLAQLKAATKKGLGKQNPTARSIRKKFAGRVGSGKTLYFPKGTPQGLAKLGKLVSIKTEKTIIKPALRNPHGGEVWLCSDTKGKLHIGTTSKNPLFDGPAGSLGKVKLLEYAEAKPHLGKQYKNAVTWFHRMGEVTGTKPTLYADGKGGLRFKGGAYKITRRGIEN